jgi:hypothetical protein
VTAWQPTEQPATRFAPTDELSTLDLPKLATTSKSMSTIAAERAAAAAAAEQAEHAPEPATVPQFTPLAAAHADAPLVALPTFADIAGLAPNGTTSNGTTSNGTTPDVDAPTIVPPVQSTAEPVFETETLWTPPPADHTAHEIWHLVDEMDAPAPVTPAHEDDSASRGRRRHLSRKDSRKDSRQDSRQDSRKGDRKGDRKVNKD